MRLADGVDPARYSTWAISAYTYWRIPERSDWIDATIVPSLTYKDTREKSDDVLFCQSIDTSGPFSTNGCKTLGMAPPKHIETFVPGFEVRLLWKGFRRSRLLVSEIALAPKITYDIDDERYGMNVPLYFAVSEDKSLTAGLKYSREWGGVKPDGEARDVVSGLAIVVGKTFSLVPK